MSDASSTGMNLGDERAEVRVSKPMWLEGFLTKTFFDPCSDHPIRKNEMNKYCINCDLSVCQYCVSSGEHRHHKILKIYRHVYKDVVSLTTMEKYINCSQIQPYKCNKRLVLSLNPLPHAGSILNEEASCNSCCRKLTDPHLYSYCSISCKVEAVENKSDDSAPPFISIETPLERQEEENQEEVIPEVILEPVEPREVEAPNLSFRKRKRKGTPRRAPFF